MQIMEPSGRVTLESPYSGGEAVNIGGGDHTFTKPTRAIWVGTGGAVAIVVEMLDGNNLTFNAIASGTLLHVRAAKVIQAGTGTSNMVGLW